MYVMQRRYVVIFVLALCPVIALPFFRFGGAMPNTAANLFGMAFMLPAGCIMFLPRNAIQINSADILLSCFLLLCCIPPALRQDIFSCMGYISLLLTYIAFRMFPAGRMTSLLLPAFVISCLMQSVYGFLQNQGYAKSLHPMYPFTGSFYNPAHLSSFLSIGTVLSAGMFLFSRQFSGIFPFVKRRLFQAFALVGGLWLTFILLLANSRAAWAGTLLSVLFLIACKINWRRFPKSLRIASAITVFCLFCAGGYFLYHYKKDSADGRMLIWKITSEMIGRKPVTGNGAGSFRGDYPYAQAAYFAKHPDTPERMLADNTTRPFNEYLRILFEHGIAGLLLLVATGFLVFRSSAPAVLKAVLLAGAVICLFSYPLEIWCIKTYWIIVLALSVSYIQTIRTIKHILPARCIYAVFTFCMATFILFYANHVRNYTGRWYQAENLEEMMTSSYPVLRNNHEYLEVYYRFLKRENKNEEAMQQMKALARLSPSSVLFYEMGDLLLQEHQYQEAEQSYMLAYHMMPAAFVPLHRLMKLYVKTGQNDKAKAVAESIIQQPVKVKTNVTDRIKNEAIEILKNK